MRGAQGFRFVGAPCTGIIPADAGNTNRIWLSWMRSPDHPRGCGEHSRARARATTCRGSSPRMRGARWTGPGRPVDARIIPADAGSTLSAGQHSPANGDHPRGCGEHRRYVDVEYPIRGSSPRMRGAPTAMTPNRVAMRIIPADAGSTPSGTCSYLPSRDHPRGCGEHTIVSAGTRRVSGSSPRMRGAPEHSRQRLVGHGIIPADAGSTNRLYL